MFLVTLSIIIILDERLTSFFPPLFEGNEGPQVRRVLTRVHSVCQPEETHADPQQRQTLPVSRLLQELHPETDAEDTHDRSLACQTLQMQGQY